MNKDNQSSAKGTLVIIGGHEDRNPEGKRTILREIADRVDGGKLVIATIASSNPEGYFEDYKAAFADLHTGELVELYLDERSDAEQPDTIELLEDARGIFFTGGHQLRLTSMIGGTAIGAWLARFHSDGGLIAGTSAGASAMSETMLVSGDSDESGRADATAMAPGLGLLEGVIIDQHFAERGRMGRLVGAVAAAPKSLGLGLDEDTAAVVEDGSLHVIGSGAAYILDASDVSHSNVSEASVGKPITIHDVRLHVLASDSRYDLEARKPHKAALP